MKAWLKYTGPAGLILWLISLSALATTFEWRLFNWIALLSGGALMVIYWVRKYQSIKEFFSTRSFKQSSNIFVMCLLVLGIVILVNIILIRHNYRWDTTKGKLFSLSPQSKKIVRELKNDVLVKAFFRPSNQTGIRDLLSEYADQSNRFQYEIIDPDVNPGLVKQYNIESYGTIVLEHKDNIEQLKEDTEQEITNALIKVTREGVRKIYFTTMHGEHDIDNVNPEGLHEAKQGLEKENYKVEKLFLAEKQTVPEDCAVLVICGPNKDLLEIEYQAIEKYLDPGGKLFILLDPEQPDLLKLLSQWGFEIGNNTIIDVSPVGQLFGAGYGSPLITRYEAHEITENFNLMSIFRLARSVTSVAQPDSGITVKTLIQTTEFPGSWAETNLEVDNIQFDEGKDLKGPISIVAIAEKDVTSGPDSTLEADSAQRLKTRIAVFGDSDFITNAYYHFQGNKDLFLNVISWLAEQGDLISIRSKEPADNRLALTALQSQIIFWFGVVLLPLSILIAGMVIYAQRK